MLLKNTVISSAIGVISGIAIGMLIQRRRHECLLPTQPRGTTAHEIESHILATQKPARVLGIRVLKYSDDTLSLRAPLNLNHNVHGTAFAGSLYALGVLCSYYLFRQWLHRHGLTKYELVAKTGSIQYIRPVATPWIVATSQLPSQEVLESFRNNLVSNGKATGEVSGCIVHYSGKVACKYSVEVCAYLPRKTR